MKDNMFIPVTESKAREYERILTVAFRPQTIQLYKLKLKNFNKEAKKGELSK